MSDVHFHRFSFVFFFLDLFVFYCLQLIIADIPNLSHFFNSIACWERILNRGRGRFIEDVRPVFPGASASSCPY